MIRNGKELQTRNANKVYHSLDDLDGLYAILKEKSIGQLAKEWEIPNNSIRYRVFKYFPENWIKNIKKDRKYKYQKDK